MFFLMGNDKAEKKAQATQISSVDKVKELFKLGRFPVVTTQEMADRNVAKVLGLVCCRGFDADEAFFGMAAMAQNKGGQGIIGYSENVAFHPDGSKFFSCFGTAVMFNRDSRDIRNSMEDNLGTLNVNTSGLSMSKDDYFGSQMGSLSGTSMYSYEDEDAEDLLNLAVDTPSEEEDPVLQRLLAQKEQSATQQ